MSIMHGYAHWVGAPTYKRDVARLARVALDHEDDQNEY